MINKSSLLAIRALIQLAQLLPEENAGVVSIAQKINAPANYLGKVLQSLVAHGLVVSQKGKGGGFRLKKSPKKISLFDVVESFEDTGRLSICFLGRKQCLDSAPCKVHSQWREVNQINIDFLKGLMLADLTD